MVTRVLLLGLSLEDLRCGAMSSSPLSGPNPGTYGVPFVGNVP